MIEKEKDSKSTATFKDEDQKRLLLLNKTLDELASTLQKKVDERS